MNKKLKNKVSDFNFHIQGYQTSCNQKQTNDDLATNLSRKNKIVIDFEDNCDNKHSSANLITNDNIFNKKKLNQGNLLRSCIKMEDKAHVYFYNGITHDYSLHYPLFIANNFVSLSLLRFDFENDIYHFHTFKKLYQKPKDFFTSVSFFEQKYPQFILSATINGIVTINDINKDKCITNIKEDPIHYAKSFDNIYSIANNKGILSLYDVRDSSYSIGKINCLTDVKSISKDLFVDNIKKYNHRLLVSTNQETFIYDLRQLNNSANFEPSETKGKRNSLTYISEDSSEISQITSRLNRTKTFFLDAYKAVIIDFIQNTLDLYDIESYTIHKSLYFSKTLYDLAYDQTKEVITVLLQNELNNKELAFFDKELTLQGVHIMKNVPYVKLGFIDSKRKLLLHSTNNYEVVELLDIMDKK